MGDFVPPEEAKLTVSMLRQKFENSRVGPLVLTAMDWLKTGFPARRPVMLTFRPLFQAAVICAELKVNGVDELKEAAACVALYSVV